MWRRETGVASRATATVAAAGSTTGGVRVEVEEWYMVVRVSRSAAVIPHAEARSTLQESSSAGRHQVYCTLPL